MSEADRLRVTYLNLSKDPKSPVIATMGFYVISMDMYLSKAKLVRKKDGDYYIAPPSEKYIDPKTGKEAYGNFFWFGEKSSEFFQKEGLKAIKTYCLTKGLPDPTKLQPRAKEQHSEPFQSMDEYPNSKETQSTFKNINEMTNNFV